VVPQQDSPRRLLSCHRLVEAPPFPLQLNQRDATEQDENVHRGSCACNATQLEIDRYQIPDTMSFCHCEAG